MFIAGMISGVFIAALLYKVYETVKKNQEDK